MTVHSAWTMLFNSFGSPSEPEKTSRISHGGSCVSREMDSLVGVTTQRATLAVTSGEAEELESAERKRGRGSLMDKRWNVQRVVFGV